MGIRVKGRTCRNCFKYWGCFIAYTNDEICRISHATKEEKDGSAWDAENNKYRELNNG